MSQLRMLLPGSAVVGDLDDVRGDAVQALADLYSYPDPLPAHGWVRAGTVSTLDGSATGSEAVAGTIGGAAARTVRSVLRGLADVILLGAGTARARACPLPLPERGFADRRRIAGQRAMAALALVTRSGHLPDDPDLFADGTGTLVVTCAEGDVGGLRHRFGHERVVVAGEDDVDPLLAASQLAARGMPRILLEGGSQLLGRFVAAGRLDEICLTVSPVLVAGEGLRIARGNGGLLRLRSAHLVECDELLFGRWLVQPS